MSDYSDEEIDLRPYIEAVIDKWYWILGLGLLAGVLAYFATQILVIPTYEATALVSITEPRQRVQFDPRIITVEDNQPLKVYPEIAVSDELLETLYAELPDVGVASMQGLRSMLDARPGSDPSLLRLTARNAKPETAAIIANGWAGLFVSWANKAYGDSGEDQLLFFEQRLEDAAIELETAEQALVDFQTSNRSVILGNELQALQQTHADLLAKEGEIEFLFQDIESLLVLSENASNGDNTSAADQFAAFLLKLRAFGGAPSQEEMVPWQLQVSTDLLDESSAGSQELQLRQLQGALAIQSEETNAAIAAIEPKILDVQKEKQEANAIEARLQRDVQLAEDTHTALARTVEEKRITSQDTDGGVRLASRSAVPTAPNRSHKSTNALAAAVGVILLTTLIIIVITWWGSDQSSSEQQSTGAGIQDDDPAYSGREI